MPLNKTRGNMYSWITHTHSHLRGECSHQCSYCYTRYGRAAAYYTGPLRLSEKELSVNYGSGKIIFIEHMNDLFAENIFTSWILLVLSHARKYPLNTYVWQTKNPSRYRDFTGDIPGESILGTTIETNRKILNSHAPHPSFRMEEMAKLNARKFVTIEPIMDFDLEILLDFIKRINPEFVNIGADSKGNNLPEPSFDKVISLLCGLKDLGIEVHQKTNLDRLVRPNERPE